jgi:PAS domain S-box-containing protein
MAQSGLSDVAEAVFAQSPMIICILEGPRHTFTFANPAYRRLLGRPDPIGKDLMDVFPELRGQGWEQLLEKVKATGRPERGNEVLVQREPTDGARGELYFNFVYSPKRNEAGETDGVLVSAVDVTESVIARRSVETLAASLRESEQRLRRVVDAAGTGTWEVDVGSASVTGDAAYRKLMGLPRDGTLSIDACVQALHPDEREVARRAIAHALGGENDGLFAIEHRTAGTPPRWIEFRGQARFAADGRAVGMAGTAMDVTARKQIEAERQRLFEAARRSESDFRSLAELIPQQVWTADPEGALDFVNGRVLEYFAEGEEQILGSGWQSIIHPDDLANCLELWSHSLRTGDEYEVEFRLRRADGEYRWHLGRAVPRRDGTGRIVKWFGTSTDFDETKKTRDELARRTEFEQHLLGIVSHDLRHPLTIITLAAAILARRGRLDDLDAKGVQRIRAAADSATRMIRDLLDFTQARLGGGIAISRSPVSLPDIVRGVIEEEEASHPGRQVIVTHQGEGLGNWDGDRISQVVQNLVSNAIKYSPPESPVRVTTWEDAESVALAVHNEGRPILREDLARIFEPLQRAGAEIDRTGRSVGLGLYIVKALLSAHGGTIEVTSGEDGTTFTARLPRAWADVEVLRH